MRITASASCFVPKPQTPFQWDAQDTLEQFREKQAHLKVVMKTKNVTYNWHDAETSVLEGVIARGDRRQGKAILLAWQRGCKMDGCRRFATADWIPRSTHPVSARWTRSFRGITSAAARAKSTSSVSGSVPAKRLSRRTVCTSVPAAVQAHC